MAENQDHAVVALTIWPAPEVSGTGFRYDVVVDGEPVRANQHLSAHDARPVRELSRHYGTLFEGQFIPHLQIERQAEIGDILFTSWLGQAWQDAQAKIDGRPITFLVASEDATALNLPWELLRPPSADFFGFEPLVSVRRLAQAKRNLDKPTRRLRPGPLRILFMACAPEDQEPLDYEREEVALFDVIARVGRDVAFDSGDMGTYDELLERVTAFEPHVVHLTGHGIAEKGLGYFAFENEEGKTDLRSSLDLRGLLAGSGVQCVFISGCQTGKAPPVAAIGGICQGLASAQVPLVLGWAASIDDDLATAFAETLYGQLARGATVDRALTQARRAIRKDCDERGDPSWTLPVLYAATTQALPFDRKLPDDPPKHRPIEQQPLEGMSQGYARWFVGRRRELQRWLPALRRGTINTLILTGAGGIGKSTLATRLARKLEAEGWAPIPIPSAENNLLGEGRLIEAFRGAFDAAGLRDAASFMDDASVSPERRLQYAITILNKERFILVLDNFEVNLDWSDWHIIDPKLAAFYEHLLTHMTGRSRAIITSRYAPVVAVSLPPIVLAEQVPEFTEAVNRKFLLRDEVLRDRFRRGDLSPYLLTELHRVFGGTPRFLDQITAVLHELSADELERELTPLSLPTETEPNRLEAAREQYCNDILTPRLYARLSPESRQALSRVAVLDVAVPDEGLAAVAGEPPERIAHFLNEWQAAALVFPTKAPESKVQLWSVYGVLTGWLIAEARLSADDRRDAHLAAGAYLREMVAAKRQGELGLTWIDCLQEARQRFLAGGDHAGARGVTERVTRYLLVRGLYDEVIRLNDEMLQRENHPGPRIAVGRAQSARGQFSEARAMFQDALAVAEADSAEASNAWYGLATIDANQGTHEAAREKFGRSLAIKQAIGDRAGEAYIWQGLATIDIDQEAYEAAHEKLARSLEIYQELRDRRWEGATLHGLAVIDVRQGAYEAAREKLRRSLEIAQAIDDLVMEAAALNEASYLALQLNQREVAFRLAAVAFLLLAPTGHAFREKAASNLIQLAHDLGYDEETIHRNLDEVGEEYRQDRGRGLIDQAFAQADPGDASA